MSQAPATKRQLGLVDCIGIGINGIIGTGIFLLPARVFLLSGGMSWAAWLAVGGLCILVGLCFAEVASMTERTGGPYAYARAAFGEGPGFVVGWIALSSSLLGYSGVARGLGQNLALAETGQIALALGVIGGLGAINWFGVKPGAMASNLFSAAKLVPLLLFVAVGLWFVDWSRVGWSLPPGGSLTAAGLAGVFACTGFEYIPVPAGETANPRRNVPIALIGSIVACIALYVLVQIVVIGTHPHPGAMDRAVAEAAGGFAGSGGAMLITIGAVVSSFGFCSGSALVSPRYVQAFAEDGILPRAFAATHQRYLTPTLAILVVSGIAATLSVMLDFNALADLSNVATFAQYVPTCLAVIVLRWKKPDAPRGFRLPLGPLIPLLAVAGCGLFLFDAKWKDVRFSLIVAAVGLAAWAIRRLAARR